MINSQYTGVDANLVENQLVNSGAARSEAGTSNGLAAAISWQSSVALLLDSRFGLASDRAKMRLPLPETVIVGRAASDRPASRHEFGINKLGEINDCQSPREHGVAPNAKRRFAPCLFYGRRA
jgi:hypothetical protein